MKQEVTLTEHEVNRALLDYAEKHGVRFTGMSSVVTVVAGRGERGVYATIALEPTGSPIPAVSESEYSQAIEELQEGNFDLEEVKPNTSPQEVFEDIEEDIEEDIDPETNIFG